MPWPRSVMLSPGCVPAVERDLLRAVERRHAERAPSAADGGGDVDDRHEVVAVADEALVLARR